MAEEIENMAAIINQSAAITANGKRDYQKAQALALISIAQSLININKKLPVPSKPIKQEENNDARTPAEALDLAERLKWAAKTVQEAESTNKQGEKFE